MPLKNPHDESWARCGLAYADISTGEFAATEIGADHTEAALGVPEEMARLKPREVLLPKSWADRGVTFAQWRLRHAPLPDSSLPNSALPRRRSACTLPGARPGRLRPSQQATRHLRCRRSAQLPCTRRKAAIWRKADHVAQLTPQPISWCRDLPTRAANLRANWRPFAAAKCKGSARLSALDRTVTPMGQPSVASMDRSAFAGHNAFECAP